MTPRANKSPASYGDVIPILQRAVGSPRGLRYALPSWRVAVNFRQRCYRYRNLLRRLQYEEGSVVPGLGVSTPFDTLELVLVQPDGSPWPKPMPERLKASPCHVLMRHRAAEGQLLDLDGNPIEDDPTSDLDLDLE